MTHINILSELYMESGRYEETYSLIQRAERMATGGEDGDTAAEAPAVMPLDLTVKAGETNTAPSFCNSTRSPARPFLGFLESTMWCRTSGQCLGTGCLGPLSSPNLSPPRRSSKTRL